MVRKKLKKLRSPDKVSRTIFVQSSETGLLEGRKALKTPTAKGDTTKAIRFQRGPRKGEISGRTKSIPVRGSKTKRGGTRRL